MAITNSDKLLLISPDVDTVDRRSALIQSRSKYVTVGEIAQQSLNLQGVFNLRSVSYDTTIEIHDGVEINAGGSTVVGRAAMSGATLTENASSWYTIVGYGTGKDMVSSSGGYITAIGAAAGEGSNGNYCVYIGNGAARLMVHGDTPRNSNVAIGVGAMYLGLNQQGVAIGHEAGRNAHGLRNIHIGYEAGENVGTQVLNSDDNIIIGYQAGKGSDMLSGNTIIGKALLLNSTETISNTVVIGAGNGEKLRIDSDGSATFASGDYLKIQEGTTGDRPASPVNGMIRYNTTTNKFEGYAGGIWVDLH